jgi:hypothetical protein
MGKRCPAYKLHIQSHIQASIFLNRYDGMKKKSGSKYNIIRLSVITIGANQTGNFCHE